jgi:hypothetical protein
MNLPPALVCSALRPFLWVIREVFSDMPMHYAALANMIAGRRWIRCLSPQISRRCLFAQAMPRAGP